MAANKKIVTIEEWSTLRSSLQGKKIVHCHGVFDLLHIGHIKHLHQAKSFGEILVVTVTPDRFVNKGPGHPAFPEALRAEAISALGCTDYVIVNKWPTAIEIIKEIQPSFYVKGDEYQVSSNDVTGKISEEQNAVEAVGGAIKYTTDITFSSSNLINKYLPTFPEHVQKWLFDFSGKYSIDELYEHLDSLGDIRVTVLGETIIDEYHYCNTMGKSGKEPVLATRYLNEERYAGGVLAVANHVAAFAKSVDVVSFIGEDRNHEKFIEDNLAGNVTSHLIEKKDSPTLVKRRFVEKNLNQKLFEVYEMNDEYLSSENEQELKEILEPLFKKTDLVIVTDYGHGMITPGVAEFLAEGAPYLVVNTQANAGNHGMNSVMKYPRTDFVTMTGRELALEVRQKGNARVQTKLLCETIDAPKMLVTAGSEGLLLYENGLGFSEAPAFAVKVTDRVGAGDTVLSIAALMVFKNIPSELVCFMGNVVGAEAVTIMGNSKYLDKSIVKKHVSHLLK